jgi:hypothetical protein
MSEHTPSLYGTIGEFAAREHVIGAAVALMGHGLTRWDVYGPAPIEEIIAIVPTRRGRYITVIMVAAALFGAGFGYFIQYWDAVINYPINVGGRPLNGWPGFIPSAWEICALFTVWFGLFAFLLFCRLSRLYHPIFTAPGFERASQDRFFICVEAADRRYRTERIRSIFGHHHALRVAEIVA